LGANGIASDEKADLVVTEEIPEVEVGRAICKCGGGEARRQADEESCDQQADVF